MLHGLEEPGNSSLNRIHKHLHQRLYVAHENNKAFKQTKKVTGIDAIEIPTEILGGKANTAQTS